MGRPSGFSPKTAALIITRDGGRCFKCGKPLSPDRRGIDWSIHHRRPRGNGGSRLAWVNAASNGVLLCGHATSPDGCHHWVEAHRYEARELGYLVPINGTLKPADVPVLRWDGTLVHLTDDGQAQPIGEQT